MSRYESVCRYASHRAAWTTILLLKELKECIQARTESLQNNANVEDSERLADLHSESASLLTGLQASGYGRLVVYV